MRERDETDEMPARDHLLEQKILNGSRGLEEGLYYAQDVIKGKWPEWEAEVLRQAEEQPIHLHLCVEYAVDVIKGRWPDLEPVLFQVAGTDPKYANDEWADAVVEYARDVIQGPWPSFESWILNGQCQLNIAIAYTAGIRQGPWQELENLLLRATSEDAMVALAYYASAVLKGRWPDAESFFLDHFSDESSTCVVAWYAQHAVKGELTTSLHSMMTMMSFQDPEDDCVKSYFEFLKTLQP